MQSAGEIAKSINATATGDEKATAVLFGQVAKKVS
jgi:hypothetical protein